MVNIFKAVLKASVKNVVFSPRELRITIKGNM